MRIHKKILLFFVLLFFVQVNIFGQSETTLQSAVQSLAEVFDSLDTSRVPSGYLSDKAIDLVRLSAFDGQSLTDSNYVDASLFLNLFRTMNFARIGTSQPEYDISSIGTSITSNISTVKLAAAAFKYNYIADNAVANNLINYNQNEGKAYDNYIDGVWQNPYLDKYVFMFTSSRPQYKGSVVPFNLSDFTILGNCNVNSYQFDFGDGAGYVSIEPSTVHTVYYNSYGKKELKMRVLLPGGITLESHSFIIIESQDVSLSSAPDTTTISADLVIPVEVNGLKAICSIKFHTGGGPFLTKPFIYVEGFDHPILAEFTKLSLDSFDKILNDECTGNYDFSYVYKSIGGRLNQKSFDFVYVDWDNHEADIKQNAAVLIQVIKEINNRKAQGSNNRNVLVGHSMGGLIARWALRQMEISNEPHYVDCFVSQDVPHMGAVVPIGAQHTIRDLYDCLFGSDGNNGISCNEDLKTVVDKIVGVLDSTSARQMMYNYVSNNHEIDNSVHNVWQSELNEIGFPHGDVGHPIENLAIISGGNLGSEVLSQTILNTTLSLTQFKSLCNLFSFSNLFAHLKIDRDRGVGSLVSETIVSYTHSSSLFQPGIILFANKSHRVETNNWQYDMVRGSYLGADYLRNLFIPLPNIFFSLFGNAKIVFVPTASALALYNYNTDYYSVQPPHFCSFNSYCIENDAMRHDHNLWYYIKWIMNHVSMKITGPKEFLLDGDSLNVTDEPSDLSFEWSSSDQTIASISNSGVVSVYNSGIINFERIAIDTVAFELTHYIPTLVGLDSITVSHKQKRYYRKVRSVLAGFPDMNLNAVHQSGNDYSVTATCVSSDSELRSYVDTLAARGVLKYIWGIKNSDNTYTWSDTTSTRGFAYTVQPNSLVHVCMKLCDSLGRVSTTINDVEIDRRSTVKYLYEPDIMTVTSLGSIYHYQNLSGTTMSNNHYFCTWKNPDYSPAPAAPDNITVKGDYIPLKTSYYTNVAGVNTTVYCFEFLQSSELQDAIDKVLSNSSIKCAFIPIQIRNGTTVLQDVMFYVEKPARVPDLPQPLH